MTDSITKSTAMWMGGITFTAITTTATGMHYLYDQFVIPLKVFESSQQVEKLNTQLEGQTAAIKELNSIKDKLDRAQQKLEKIELTDLFLKGDPYPSTVDVLKVGQPVSAISGTYSKDQITWPNESEGDFLVRVKIQNSVFNRILYMYDETTKKITSTSFVLDYNKDFSKDFLYTSLSKALGTPETSKRKGQFKWRIKGVGSAYIIMSDTYMIVDNHYAPRSWSE